MDEAKTVEGNGPLVIATLLASTTLAFPGLAGVTFFLQLLLTTGFSPFGIGCPRNHR